MSIDLGASKSYSNAELPMASFRNSTHPNMMDHLWWQVESWWRKRQGPIEQLHVLSVAIDNSGTPPAFWGILYPDSTPAYTDSSVSWRH